MDIRNVKGRVILSVPGNSLRDADLRGANLYEADLCDADLRGANLYEADLCDAELCDANLREANLREANLSGADLCEANLREANLSGANLSGADLCEANLRGANLSGANLSGANLSRANLSEANLREVGGAVSIGPIGSRGSMLCAVCHPSGIHVYTGCFGGTLDELSAAVEKTHGGNKHGRAYQAAIAFIREFFVAQAIQEQ